MMLHSCTCRHIPVTLRTHGTVTKENTMEVSLDRVNSRIHFFFRKSHEFIWLDVGSAPMKMKPEVRPATNTFSICIFKLNNTLLQNSFPRWAKRLFRGGQGNRLGASVTINEAFTEAVRLRQPPQLIEINRDSFSYLTTSVKNFHNKKKHIWF